MNNEIDRKTKIKSLLDKGILIGGIVTRTPEGYILFERINDIQELLEKEANGSELGFATKTMGRAIFSINEDGEIENYKGVESQLGEHENPLIKQTGANIAKIPNPVYKGHQIVLKSSPKNSRERAYEIRFNGTSPLEDLEIEAEVNSQLSKFGVKVPRIISVKEFPKDLATKLGLPTTVKGSYEELTSKSTYAPEDKRRKDTLKSLDIEYFDSLQEGERPELLIEYFKRFGLLEDERFEEFINNERKLVNDNSKGIMDFIKGADEDFYSLGQRHGQTTRIVGSPFRISDLEGFVDIKNVEAINDIIKFSQLTIPDCSLEATSVEELFAKQMGKNIALLINNGWCLQNFAHRQDYNLAGEMCDDSYYDINQEIAGIEREVKNPYIKKATIKELYDDYLGQIHFMSSNIKVLEDEMTLRGIDEKEIAKIKDLYAKSLIESLDIEEISKSMGINTEKVKEKFIEYFDTSKDSTTLEKINNLPKNYMIDPNGRRDYVLELAAKDKGASTDFNEPILRASKGCQDFYRYISDRCSEYFKEKYQVFDKDFIDSDISEIASEKLARDVQAGQTEVKNQYKEYENPNLNLDNKSLEE